MKLPPELLHLVEDTLAEYLKNPVFGDEQFAARHRALPLYAGWYGTTYLTTAGEFWFHSTEDDPPRLENDLNESTKLVALVLASERHPQLRALLPVRPADAQDCEVCDGRGQITVGNVSNIICGQCSALGWRPAAVSDDDGSYPSFDSALEKFRAFARSQELSTELVFLSAEHALLKEHKLYVTAEAFLTDADARRSYERAVASRNGVGIGAVGELADGRLVVCVYGPQTQNEAERLMYPNGLKLTVPQRRVTVSIVARLRMRWMRLLSSRHDRERTHGWFR